MTPDGRETTLDALLKFVKESRGFDFTGYKRSSIERRVTKRMKEVGLDNYDAYLDHLQLHADEFADLFNAILINVTGFFRDPQMWEYMASEALPQLIAARPEGSPIRVWSAGCASGEEPYTIAMVLARVLGDDAFRERVKIYATDIDEDALDQARQGTYLPRQVEDIPQEALDRFFERHEHRYAFRKDFRRAVIFGRNDLIQDAPISHIDLLVCRNTLMYFTADTQSQILRRFHFALDDDGILQLGKSEMLISHTDLFTPVDVKRRVFRKVFRPTLRERVRAIAVDPGNGASQSVTDTLREAAFDTSSSAQIVLDAGGALVMANDAARRMFGLVMADFGRPIQDLELSYRPLELRSHLELLVHELRPIEINGVRWRAADNERILDVRLAPLLGDRTMLGVSVTYIDATARHQLQEQLTTSKRELDDTYEELQSTVEELETTNEELQSTNEELEATNEELQSSNEELETMNEELQSSNEELETMNDELRRRTRELHDVNSFMEAIVTTAGLAVAVIDRSQNVQIWNGQARELWGLNPEEAEDQNLMALDIGLPLEKLKPRLHTLLAGQSGHEQLVLEAIDRRGRAFRCRVTATPLDGSDGDAVSGAIILMEPLEGAAASSTAPDSD